MGGVLCLLEIVKFFELPIEFDLAFFHEVDSFPFELGFCDVHEFADPFEDRIKWKNLVASILE